MGLHKGLFVEGSVALQEIHNSIFWSLHAAEIAGSNLVEFFLQLGHLIGAEGSQWPVGGALLWQGDLLLCADY